MLDNIVTELEFKRLVAQIPTYTLSNAQTSMTLKFGFGDQKELLKVLNDNNNIYYPLLWLVMPFEEEEHINHMKADLTFVLAVNNKPAPFYEQRYRTTFQEYLYPYFNLFKQALEQSKNIEVRRTDQSKEFNVIKHPNYGKSDDTEHVATDPWDALKINFRARIESNNCPLNFNFNTENLTQWQY